MGILNTSGTINVKTHTTNRFASPAILRLQPMHNTPLSTVTQQILLCVVPRSFFFLFSVGEVCGLIEALRENCVTLYYTKEIVLIVQSWNILLFPNVFGPILH